MRLCLALVFSSLALLTARQTQATSAAELERLHEYARALEANPRLSSAWIALGLDAEGSTDHPRELDDARRDLLEAARVDRGYLPAWTLTGFFYRHNDPSEFWTWARRATEFSYDDLRPVLQLAHSMESNPGTVAANLGASDKLLRADLDFLVQTKNWPGAQSTARALLNRRHAADKPRLLEAADRQLGAGNAPYALELWSAFYPPRLLTNGALDQPPSNLGFDWRLPPAEGIAAEWQPGVLNFRFNGSQCEECSLLQQVLAPPAAKRYRLHYQARITGLASPSGLHWTLGTSESASLEASPEASPEWRAFSTGLFSPPPPRAPLRRLRFRASA
jgi:hypothetical protein